MVAVPKKMVAVPKSYAKKKPKKPWYKENLNDPKSLFADLGNGDTDSEQEQIKMFKKLSPEEQNYINQETKISRELGNNEKQIYLNQKTLITNATTHNRNHKLLPNEKEEINNLIKEAKKEHNPYDVCSPTNQENNIQDLHQKTKIRKPPNSKDNQDRSNKFYERKQPKNCYNVSQDPLSKSNPTTSTRPNYKQSNNKIIKFNVSGEPGTFYRTSTKLSNNDQDTPGNTKSFYKAFTKPGNKYTKTIGNTGISRAHNNNCETIE